MAGALKAASVGIPALPGEADSKRLSVRLRPEPAVRRAGEPD